MRGGAWAWLVVLGLMGPAGAQEVRGAGGEGGDETRVSEDLPDNMDAFRRTPHTDDQPQTDEQEGLGGMEGTGGAGTAGTGEEEPEVKPETEKPEAPKP